MFLILLIASLDPYFFVPTLIPAFSAFSSKTLAEEFAPSPAD
jgi:hypothetical protein